MRKWQGFGQHSGRTCPYAPGNEHLEAFHWRRVGWRRVVRPILTVTELWPTAWRRAGEEERAHLVELARPVLAEVWRQLEAQRLARGMDEGPRAPAQGELF